MEDRVVKGSNLDKRSNLVEGSNLGGESNLDVKSNLKKSEKSGRASLLEIYNSEHSLSNRTAFPEKKHMSKSAYNQITNALFRFLIRLEMDHSVLKARFHIFGK